MAGKAPTGIEGLDGITGGGVPRGRVTVVTGGAGTGKTLFSWSFLNDGNKEHGEKGLAVTFDLTEAELTEDLAGIGIDLGRHLDRGIFLHTIDTKDYAAQLSGEFSLKGLEVIVESYVRRHGIRRFVLDSIQGLLRVARDRTILRREVGRFFLRLKEWGVTSLIVSEAGGGEFDLDFLSDCNIRLDLRIVAEMATRRLWVSKLRGSFHETNEFPFLIDNTGIKVVPLSSIRLSYDTSETRLSTGIAGLDEMLEGEGYFKGSAILISGTAGTGKTSLAGWLAHSLCRTGKKSLFFSFEESESQVIRNLKRIGIDLTDHRDSRRLRFYASNSSEKTLEQHLGSFLCRCQEEGPDLVIFDPITNFINIGSDVQVKNILMRLIDCVKGGQITSVFTSLTSEEAQGRNAGADISSLMDLWIQLDTRKVENDRQKTLRLVKARGIDCDTSDRHLVLSNKGIAVGGFIS